MKGSEYLNGSKGQQGVRVLEWFKYSDPLLLRLAVPLAADLTPCCPPPGGIARKYRIGIQTLSRPGIPVLLGPGSSHMANTSVISMFCY
jgi:hypothetical protein